MSSRQGGAQSPPPERLHGSQKDAPSSGKSGDAGNGEDYKRAQREFLEKLPSNPKGPMDDHAEYASKKH
ncbi:hypothetical protein F5884DRAFT_858070 [Xylogone sp. PMI_703]|nr:hypothetical protein F5884DRAFT_858070 [Xylogone sp. PMI_703]